MTGTYSDPFDMGATIVDSLDTLWLMNLTFEFSEARQWIDSDLKFGLETQDGVNLFETTIRVLGVVLYNHPNIPRYILNNL